MLVTIGIVAVKIREHVVASFQKSYDYPYSCYFKEINKIITDLIDSR